MLRQIRDGIAVPRIEIEIVEAIHHVMLFLVGLQYRDETRIPPLMPGMRTRTQILMQMRDLLPGNRIDRDIGLTIEPQLKMMEMGTTKPG